MCAVLAICFFSCDDPPPPSSLPRSTGKGLSCFSGSKPKEPEQEDPIPNVPPTLSPPRRLTNKPPDGQESASTGPGAPPPPATGALSADVLPTARSRSHRSRQLADRLRQPPEPEDSFPVDCPLPLDRAAFVTGASRTDHNHRDAEPRH